MKYALFLLSVAVLCACSTTRRSVGDAESSKARFAMMCSLVGDWAGTVDANGNSNPVETRFRLTGNGSVVSETLFPGTEHEMVSMYHLDGASLMHTHYCSAGNQPRMVAEPSAEGQTIPFAFHDATNLPDPKVLHMHEMKLHVIDANHIEEWWTGYLDGKAHHTAHFTLTRKP